MNTATAIQILTLAVVVAHAIDHLLQRVFARRPKVVAELAAIDAAIEKDAPIVANILVSSTKSDETPVTKITTKEPLQ